MRPASPERPDGPECFPIREEAVRWLSEGDPELGAVMREMDPPRRELFADLFSGLVFHVIAQQVSAKAARTEWERFQRMFGPVVPERIHGMKPAALQKAGITLRRAGYIVGIAERFASGSCDPDELAKLSDEDFCRQVTRLPGVGEWTAQMLLVHVLRRPDVISYGDLAILRGMRMVYQVPVVTREMFERRRRAYAPYATTASIYLWAISAGAVPGLNDPKARQRSSRGT